MKQAWTSKFMLQLKSKKKTTATWRTTTSTTMTTATTLWLKKKVATLIKLLKSMSKTSLAKLLNKQSITVLLVKDFIYFNLLHSLRIINSTKNIKQRITALPRSFKRTTSKKVTRVICTLAKKHSTITTVLKL